MSNLIGVVNKPQFDLEIFKPGKAIHIRQEAKTNGYQLKNDDGLIGRVNPLTIIVWLYDEKEHDCDYIEIPIAAVVNGEYKLTLMKEEK